MKIDKSLEEVWQWKEKLSNKTKDMSWREKVGHINKQAAKIHKKYNLNLPKLSSSKT